MLHDVGWVDDQRVNFLLRRTFRPDQVLPGNVRFAGAPRRVDFYRYGVADVTSRRTQLLTINEDDPWQDQGASLIAPIEGDPGFARMIGRAPGIETRHETLYRVNLSSGGVRSAAPRGVNRDTIDFLLDERGAVIARVDFDCASNRWQVLLTMGRRRGCCRRASATLARRSHFRAYLPTAVSRRWIGTPKTHSGCSMRSIAQPARPKSSTGARARALMA